MRDSQFVRLATVSGLSESDETCNKIWNFPGIRCSVNANSFESIYFQVKIEFLNKKYNNGLEQICTHFNQDALG